MKKFILFFYIILIITTFFNPIKANSQTKKEIYLTFDDGPSLNVTTKILEILKEENIKATFFIVGNEAEKRPDIVKKIYEQKNAIGLHSYSHKYKEIYKNDTTLLEDIKKCNNSITKIIPEFNCKIYRFPGGSFGLSEKLINAVKDNGYIYFDWNSSCLDSEIHNALPCQLFEGAVNTGLNKNKLIMLMHDSNSKMATAIALPDIIHYYKEKGFIFKTLS